MFKKEEEEYLFIYFSTSKEPKLNTDIIEHKGGFPEGRMPIMLDFYSNDFPRSCCKIVCCSLFIRHVIKVFMRYDVIRDTISSV